MSFSKIFLCCCISFIFGIAISAFIPPEKISADFLFYLYILFLGIIAFLFFAGQNKILKISLLLLIFFILGFWRYQISWPKTVENRIESYYNKNLTFTGIVVGEPEEGQDNQRLVVKITNVQQRSVTGKILVTAPLYPQYNYADKLKVTCKVKKPEKFNDFSYDKYLAISDIYAICGFPQIDLIAEGQGNKLYQKILNFKKKLKFIILENLTEPEASFLSAFLLGYKNDLNKTLFDNFAKTGLAHVIAISGQHITIIFVLLLSFFISLGFYRQQAFYFISLFLIFYVIIIGAPASAVRAIIMG